MRVVIQRVSSASVTIDGKIKSAISSGLMILLGIESADDQKDIEWLVKKIVNLRVFNDDQKRMNLSIKDVDGDILLISQFTLHASVKKGNRPSYIKAAHQDLAIPLYREFIAELELSMNKKIYSGEFGAMMEVALVNDGPVTIIIDSKSRE
ncbi:MAG TPA: D-tyrosyl-tRNA(Tyr) deacylase [Bacteroidetes bacterium]|nr:D-tyrosyl-tRNA(Tyr) deacylase [Bacteroidota bacterium]